MPVPETPSPDDARGATADATAAAARAEVHVLDVHGTAAFREVSAVFDAVWGRPGEAGAVLGPEVLAAIAHAGGQVSAATRGERVVGATAAFLGRTADGRTFLHSHVTGVLEATTAAGVGTALKWYQRSWCLTRGIDEVRWTFDPLVRRNVVFNLVRLGAQVDGYLEDAYGRMPDVRNAGLPTDRLVARWPLRSPRVRAAAAGRAASPDVQALLRSGAEIELDEDADGSPRRAASQAPRRLVRVPTDIERLRSDDPELATAWSRAVRATVGTAIAEGARISGATRDGWLVVSSGERVAELTHDAGGGRGGGGGGGGGGA
jgi:predicted GNAT superfamily acetyltransferase